MAWVKTPKPTESSIIAVGGGTPIGLLMAITGGTMSSSIVTGWGNVSKPSSSVWTAVVKPSSSVWTAVAKPIT